MSDKRVVEAVRGSLRRECGPESNIDGLFHFPENIRRVKIDVGLSMDAPHSRRWLAMDQDLLVIGFEPLEECRLSIEKAFTGDAFGPETRRRFWLMPFALGSETKYVKFFRLPDIGQSSIYTPQDKAVDQEFVVAQATLDLVLDQISFSDHIRRVDYVKTDCQGADYEVARGAIRNLDRIGIWTSESDSSGYIGSSNSSRNFENLFNAAGFTWMNPRSQIRIYLGRIILVSIFHNFVAWIMGKLRRTFSSQANGSELVAYIDVEDATFVNLRFRSEIAQGEISAFQKG
jgi:FkbM family methyltransferase